MLENKLNSDQFPEMLEDFLTAERNPYTGQRGIMDRTDRPHYNKFCEGIIECLKPATPLEQLLAFSIAADYWRLNRTRRIEDGIFASSHPNPTSEFGPVPIDKQIAASQTSAFLCKQADFKFLSTYEMRIQRTLNRHKTDLNKLQTERRKLEKEQPAQPPQPLNLPQTEPSAAKNGFEFSNPPVAPAPAPQTFPDNGITGEPSKIRTAANHSGHPAAKNGFEFSNSPAAPVPAPQTAPAPQTIAENPRE